MTDHSDQKHAGTPVKAADAPAVSAGKPSPATPGSSAPPSHRPSTVDAAHGANGPASQWVSTMAGTGEKGYSSGPALEAKFNTPMGVIIDSDDVLYVSDMGNQRLCRITAGAGSVVTTLAGGIARKAAGPHDPNNVDADEKVTFRDGKGTDARFNQPLLGCFDTAHHLFLADHYNHRIREIAPDGTVTTFAGSVGGDNNGKRADVGGALFDHPVSCVFDSRKNLYVADQMNHKIKRIAPDGTVTTFAGPAGRGTDTDDGHGNVDGTGAAARFNQPGALAIDAADNLYVSDARNNSIRKITPAGVVTTLAGGKANPSQEHQGCDDGAAEIATFFTPAGLAVDKLGNVYVADACNHRIRKITTDGMVSTFLGGGPSGMKNGTFVEGDGTHARFNGPMSVAIDAKNEYLFVADAFNHKIRRFRLSSGHLSCRACTQGDCTVM